MDEFIVTSREVRLRQRPVGLPVASDFEIATRSLGAPSPGFVLVRNRCTRITASIRMMLGADARAMVGVPIPPLRPGDVLCEETIGEVVAVAPGASLPIGQLVRHDLGFREYACLREQDCAAVDCAVIPPGAHLSPGWTAYAALTRAVQVRPDDTVFISGGAGAIGSMAGQIARLLGARRVIGSTGSRAKAARMIAELGYDVVLARDEQPFSRALQAAAPDGIDVCIDNVSGEQLAAAVENSRERARIVLLGALSGQLAPSGDGRASPVLLDSFPIIFRRITLRGFSADDVPEARAEWEHWFARWLRAGSIRFPHTVVRGIDGAAQGIGQACAGGYFGTVVLEY